MNEKKLINELSIKAGYTGGESPLRLITWLTHIGEEEKQIVIGSLTHKARQELLSFLYNLE